MKEDLGLRMEQNEANSWFIFWLNFDVNSYNNGLRRCLIIADNVCVVIIFVEKCLESV